MTSLSLVASADINITLANLVGNNQFMKVGWIFGKTSLVFLIIPCWIVKFC